MRRLDTGAPAAFGDITVVFNTSHVRKAVLITAYESWRRGRLPASLLDGISRIPVAMARRMPKIRGLGVVRDELRESPNRTQPTDETSEL